MKNIHVFILTLLLSTILLSCQKETINVDDISEDIDRDYELAVPGAKLHLSIEDLIKEFDNDTLLLEHADGTLSLQYKTNYNYEWSDLLTLDPVIYSWNYQLDPLNGIPIFPAGKLKKSLVDIPDSEITNIIELNMGEAIRMDSIHLYDANLTLTINIPDKLEGDIKITLPQVSLKGEILSFNVKADAGNKIITKTFSLKGYHINLLHSNNYPAGYLNLIAKFTNFKTVGIITVLPEPIKIDFTFSNILPDFAFGNFGNKPIKEHDLDIKINAFDEMGIDASISFQDFLVSLESKSVLGTALTISASDLKFTETKTNTTKNLNITNNTYTLKAAAWGIPVVPSTSILEITKANSNIMDLNLGAFKPNKITGKVNATLNPESKNVLSFVSRTGKINTTLNMSIPLWFKTSEYCRVDTVDFDYKDSVGEDDQITDNFKKGNIYFDFDNGLPFEMDLQVYLANKDYIKIDSLFKTEADRQFIIAAVTDANGLLTKSSKSTFIAGVKQEQLKKWKEADVKYVLIKTCSVTANKGVNYIKVTKKNFIDMFVSFELAGTPNIK